LTHVDRTVAHLEKAMDQIQSVAAVAA
jgi:hypothetical protein